MIDRKIASQLAGQLMMIRMPETQLSSARKEWIQTHHIRAICLFRQNLQNETQTKQLTQDLAQAMSINDQLPLIAIDQEGGAVIRATWVPHPPSAMCLGASDDEAQCEQVGAACARAIRDLGFNWNFAPVLDLNNNVLNPIIAERSFGDNPQRVAQLAQAWMRGSLREGVACCVKHFPGHGDTHTDSHRDLPTVDKSLDALQNYELQPFRQLAQSTAHHISAPAFMTAHIVYPQIDAQYPATLSPIILEDMLRKQWQYQGVIITDGMDMLAIAERYGVQQAAILALQAGADMVMALGNSETQAQTHEAITLAIMQGKLRLEEIEKKIHRIHQLALKYPLRNADDVLDVLNTRDNHHASQQQIQDAFLMQNAWQRGLTEYRHPAENKAGNKEEGKAEGKATHQALVLPSLGSQVLLVMRDNVVSDGVSEAGLPLAAMRDLLSPLYDLDVWSYSEVTQVDWQRFTQQHHRAGQYIIFVSTTRQPYPPHLFDGFSPDLHLALWNPFHVLSIASPALITYGFAPPALQALLSYLKGEIQALGRLPVQRSLIFQK